MQHPLQSTDSTPEDPSVQAETPSRRTRRHSPEATSQLQALPDLSLPGGSCSTPCCMRYPALHSTHALCLMILLACEASWAMQPVLALALSWPEPAENHSIQEAGPCCVRRALHAAAAPKGMLALQQSSGNFTMCSLAVAQQPPQHTATTLIPSQPSPAPEILSGPAHRPRLLCLQSCPWSSWW